MTDDNSSRSSWYGKNPCDWTVEEARQVVRACESALAFSASTRAGAIAGREKAREVLRNKRANLTIIQGGAA